jgi:hypothetical protein
MLHDDDTIRLNASRVAVKCCQHTLGSVRTCFFPVAAVVIIVVVVVPVWFVEPLSNEIARTAAEAEETEETREIPDADEVVEDICSFLDF